MCSYNEALKLAKETFEEKDPLEIFEKSGCFFDREKEIFHVTYCRDEYHVKHPEGVITRITSGSFTGEEEIVILQYLNWCSGLLPQRRWLSFLELPSGEMHFKPFQKEAIFPLAERYKNDLEGFMEKGSKIGDKMDLGDGAFILPVLPRIEMAAILWCEDEEYEARANVLFDGNSPSQMPTASLYVMGIQAIKRVFEI